MLADYRSKGADPSQRGAAAKERIKTNMRQASERKKREASHTMTTENVKRFKMEILPKLARVPLSKIMRAAGVSKRYASMTRGGVAVPQDSMHHRKLEGLAEGLQHKGHTREKTGASDLLMYASRAVPLLFDSRPNKVGSQQVFTNEPRHGVRRKPSPCDSG